MARPRKKKRTHIGAQNGAGKNVTAHPASKDPKTMVIRIGAGQVGPSVSQLVKDVRAIMEPGTASRLKERRSNRLRDYVAMAGPLGVSHLLLFSRSDSGNTNLRLALTPRGPTLHFRIEQYSLAKDVQKVQRHPQGGSKMFLNAPLLVMNNFTMPAPTDGSQPVIPKRLESLTTTMFQSLFPPISPQKTPISSIRRVLLLDRETPQPELASPNASYVINLRHYAISTKRIGLSRGVRRLNTAEKLLKKPNRQKNSILNLGKLDDVADYILDPAAATSGFTSASESEVETDAEIEVLDSGAKQLLNKKQKATMHMEEGNVSRLDKQVAEKRAVKMTEVGPRIKLRMTKVEEGLCGGKVMWHEYLSKTAEEIKQMEDIWERRRKEKEERRRIQKENVERKKSEKAARNGSEKRQSQDNENDFDMDESIDKEWDSEGIEDDGGMEVNEAKALANG